MSAKKLPQNKEATPLPARRIWQLGRIYFGKRPLSILGYVAGCLLCQAVLPPAIALRFGKLTNTSPTAYADPAGVYRTYFEWMALMLALLILSAAVRYFTTMLDAAASNWLRRDAFGNLMRLGPEYFHRHDPGELTMVINQVCLTAEIGLRQLLVDPLIQALSAISIGYALFTLLAGAQSTDQMHWLLPLLALLVAIPGVFLFLVRLVAPRLQRVGHALQEQGLAVSSFTGKALGSPEEIQSMGAEARFAEKHNAFLEEFLNRERRNAFTLESLNLLNQSPGNLLLFALLGTAVYFGTRSGDARPGTLVGLVLLVPSFMAAVQAIGTWRITRSQAGPALSLVDEILTSQNADSVLPEPGNGGVDPEADESISPNLPEEPDRAPAPTLKVNHLTFSYDPGKAPNALDNVSFSVPAGRITGLVGGAGEGKTTFFRLALRFYDAQGGSIEFNGISHIELERGELRRRVALLSPHPAFFQETVRQNLLLARPDATDEQLRASCEHTGVWPALEERFGKENEASPLDAEFREGEPLSGGERKLFALTRCLLREPEYIFFDEPTAGMDAETKFDFVAPMRRSCLGKTVMVVDHDLVWQLRFCDYFLVLHEGRVIEHGTGRQLLERDGTFRRLFGEQTAGVVRLLSTLDELGIPYPTRNQPAP